MNDYYLEHKDNGGLVDGYAPFCKHLFIKNDLTHFVTNCAVIDETNRPYLKSSYEARRENELPVLERYLDKNHVPVHKAAYLDIILYSKAQVQLEAEAMN